MVSKTKDEITENFASVKTHSHLRRCTTVMPHC